MDNMRVCQCCHRMVNREDMSWTYDCHGITYRLVCNDYCYDKLMEKGYDGEYYTELDENIYEDY